MEMISALALIQPLTMEQQDEILAIRQAYESLTEEEKLLVTNYEVFLEIEKTFIQMFPDAEISKILCPEQIRKNSRTGRHRSRRRRRLEHRYIIPT